MLIDDSLIHGLFILTFLWLAYFILRLTLIAERLHAKLDEHDRRVVEKLNGNGKSATSQPDGPPA